MPVVRSKWGSQYIRHRVNLLGLRQRISEKSSQHSQHPPSAYDVAAEPSSHDLLPPYPTSALRSHVRFLEVNFQEFRTHLADCSRMLMKKGRMYNKRTFVKGFFKSHPINNAPINAGKAASTAKFISFARKIWFKSSIALLKEQTTSGDEKAIKINYISNVAKKKFC